MCLFCFRLEETFLINCLRFVVILFSNMVARLGPPIILVSTQLYVPCVNLQALVPFVRHKSHTGS